MKKILLILFFVPLLFGCGGEKKENNLTKSNIKGKVKEIIENEMDCLITDVDFVIKKEGSLQALVNMLEEAINFIPCCTELKDNKELTFREYLEENDLSQTYTWLSKRGMTDSASEILRDWQLTINPNL